MKVIDLHCDLLYEMRKGHENGREIDFGKNDLHIDLEKLKKGNYLLQCFAMYVDLGESKDPLTAALEEADQFFGFLRKYPEDIAQVRNWSDLEKNRQEGKISALLTMEEGACCLGNISILRVMYELGVRIMTLTWNYENELAFPNNMHGSIAGGFSGSADTEHGLKEKGFEFIAEMEKLGIIIDVSHLSDAGFWDVADNTSRPFIASHSNARRICGHCRNLTDEMIRTIADRGGIVGLNYYSQFLEEGNDQISRVEAIAKHASYIKNTGGIDTVSLGSDFCGIEGKLEMCDASRLSMLEAELRKQKFTENEIEKIFHKNAERLLKEFL